MASASTSSSQFQCIGPNSNVQHPDHPITIFLSGPTDVPWREVFLADLAKYLRASSTPEVTVFNPFQPKWDSTWSEDYMADPKFKAQTEWELRHLESATFVVVWFDKEPKAPVSLMELGLRAGSGKALVVGCQEGFWKRGNVQAVCARFDLSLEDTLDGLARQLSEVINKEAGNHNGVPP